MFYGEKLQSVRELNGLSRKELAHKLDISEQAVWQYENQYTVPKFEVVNELKKIFGVKPQFFYKKSFIKKVSDIEKIAYRADDRESRKKAKMETTFIDFVDCLISEFEYTVAIPDGTIHSLSIETEKMFNRWVNGTDKEELLEKVACYAREVLKVDDNKDLLYKLEISGIFVLEKNMGMDIDVYSTWTNGNRPFIVLGNEKKSAVRRNFDLAHELGHLLLHKKIDMDGLSKEEHKEIEREANKFAGYFLLPREDFLRDFSKIKKKSNPKSYIEMKEKYKVSIVALGYTAYQRGYTSFQENRYFFATISREKFKEKEPLDDDIPVVRPGKIRALFNMVLGNKLIILADFLDLYSIETDFLESLFGMEADFFNPYLDDMRDDYYQKKVIDLFA